MTASPAAERPQVHETVLGIDGLSKSFGGTRALIDANREWPVPWFLVTTDNIDNVGTGHEQVLPDLPEQMETLWDKSA